jgi:hypothetical protein
MNLKKAWASVPDPLQLLIFLGLGTGIAAFGMGWPQEQFALWRCNIGNTEECWALKKNHKHNPALLGAITNQEYLDELKAQGRARYERLKALEAERAKSPPPVTARPEPAQVKLSKVERMKRCAQQVRLERARWFFDETGVMALPSSSAAQDYANRMEAAGLQTKNPIPYRDCS